MELNNKLLGPNMISLGRVLGIGLYGINNKLLGPNMISLGRVLGIGSYRINNKLLYYVFILRLIYFTNLFSCLFGPF